MMFLTAALCATMFQGFVDQYAKVYRDVSEYNIRRTIFCDNLEYIQTINARNDNNFILDANAFADLTDQEFESMYTSKAHMATMHFNNYNQTENEDMTRYGDIPATSFDWRDVGHVTPVKDQGKCGSCWAFSAVAGIEAHISINDYRTVILSEQELVDCSWLFANFGCAGGEVSRAYAYVKRNGLASEKQYPYRAVNQFCKNFGSPVKNKTFITGYKNVQPFNESRMVETLYNVGPLNVAVAASSKEFRFYKSGILDNCDTDLDHAVLVTGYGVDASGKSFFSIKNSWGTSYGENGYIRISRGTHGASGTCGVATMPQYPTVK